MTERRVTDYKILRDSTDNLIVAVRDLLMQGWQPWGAPFVVGGNILGQAMVKYDDPGTFEVAYAIPLALTTIPN